nr:hypothetical protein [uncultured Flavobacterium sp.]
MLRFFCLIILLLLSIVKSFSQEQFIIDKVFTKLNLNQDLVGLDLMKYKKLPYDNNKAVFLIPVISNPDYEYDNIIYDAYILIIDTQNGKILNKYFEKDKWISDAFRLSNFTIDTGLYKLNIKTRAFGIRVSYSGSSKPNPFSQTLLNLFIIEDNILKEIADEIVVESYGGEWDMNCEGEFTDEIVIIDIDNEMNKGFFNLILRSTVKEITATKHGEDCIDTFEIRKESKKMKFNGNTYQ